MQKRNGYGILLSDTRPPSDAGHHEYESSQLSEWSLWNQNLLIFQLK